MNASATSDPRLKAAARVELALPETGVCKGSGLAEAAGVDGDQGGGCCGAPEPLQVGEPTASAGGC